VYCGVDVNRDGAQLYISRRPDPLAHGARDVQNLPGNIPMQRVHESPEVDLELML
jgi:hypothetical protein